MVTAAPLPRVNPDFLVRPRLLDVLDEWSPITLVLAPSGAGKAVLAVQWAAHARTAGHDVIWFDGEVDRPEDVVATLAGYAGLPQDADPSVTLRRLRRALQGLDGRLAVVLNNAESVISAIGGELVDIVRDCREVHLVACLRRRLEPVGKALLEAETRVIGLADLQFTVEEVRALAALYGLEMSEAEAERVRESVGGWSALVRTGFEPVPNATPQVASWSPRHVSWFLAVNVAPLLPPSALAALCRASLVERPTYGSVLAATGPLDPVARGAIEGIGILDPLVVDGDPLVRLPPLMADFFRGRYDAGALGPEVEVHQRVVDFWLGSGAPRSALRQALLGECWPLAVEIVEQHWWELDGLDLRGIPPVEVRGHPRAEVARQAQLPEDRRPGSPPTRAWEVELTSGPPDRLDDRTHDPDALAMLTLLLMRERSRGEHPATVDLARRIDVVLGATPEGGATPVAARAALEAGRVQLLAGDLAAATRVLRVAEDASGELALCAALTGDRPGARHWLDRVAGGPSEAGVAGRMAAAIEALHALDRRRSADLLAQLRVDGVERDDLGPFAGWVEAQHALLWGGRSRVRAELAAARGSSTRQRSPEWLRDLLLAAEADLCTSLGRTALAARLLAEGRPGSVAILLARARLERVVGHPGVALSLVDEAAVVGEPSSAVEVETLVLRAWCVDESQAADALARAVRAARRDRLVLPFAHVPAALLAAHAPTVPGLTTIGDLVREADVRAPFDLVEEVPVLTPREEAVLAALARGLSLEDVGRELFVSRNTVKTQARSLYRKLRVSGREEAVRKAGRMGLLD